MRPKRRTSYVWYSFPVPSLYLNGLNEKQREAASSTEGPLLILAGAGAGKTRVITHRILHLVKSGCAPERILAVTFTNKAAREMRERVKRLLMNDQGASPDVYMGSIPFVSTFHSLGVYILRENAALLDLPKRFHIYDRTDSVRALKQAMKEVGVDPKQFEPRKILSMISRAKGKGLTALEYVPEAGNRYVERTVADVWERYENALKKEKALDFDDLLLHTVRLLRSNESVRHKWQERFSYIHVDEYQDTNAVQYELLRLLADEKQNVCVVGDIDQNIYSWRGASIDNILDFERHFPGAHVVLLEQNYRSTKTIVAASNNIIERNLRRKKKTLFTENPDGEPITLKAAYDEKDEARYIAETIQELVRKGEAKYESTAVLYRANFQSRAIEEALLALGVPYRVLGTRFFERAEIKDILSYIRAAENPESAGDIARAIATPSRGIGKVALTKILGGKRGELSGKQKVATEEFFTFLTAIRSKLSTEAPSALVKYILKESGIETLLRKGSEEEQERLENIRELVTLATGYDRLSYPEGLERFLDDASLSSDQDDMPEDNDAVTLLTVHAAKGLEFDTVFITGLEEGLFPHERMGEGSEEADDEEERRLMYVALTRARQRIFLTYALARTLFGARSSTFPSSFLSEIGEEYLVAADPSDFGESRPRVIYLDDE